MALFDTLNVAGPANRQGTIQSLAQNAAQSVLRRQRLKQLLQQGAQALSGGGSHSGPGMPFRGSMVGHSIGARGATMRPDLPADQLAEMARSAGRAGHLPGGIIGGVYGSGGGGFDFGALPAPADHSQSAASVGPSPFHAAPIAPPAHAPAAAPSAPAASSSAPAPIAQDTSNPASFTPSTYFGGVGTDLPPNVHGWIPLGGGLFYDPQNDIVRGGSVGSVGNGLVGQDGKF